MSTDLLVVMVGAAVGAPVRYLTDRWVARRFSPRLPAGTLVVNVVGSALLGGLTAAAVSGHLAPTQLALLGTGFCGGLTTFSSFAWETHELADEGAVGFASSNVVASVVGCLTAAAITYSLVSRVLG